MMEEIENQIEQTEKKLVSVYKGYWIKYNPAVWKYRKLFGVVAHTLGTGFKSGGSCVGNHDRVEYNEVTGDFVIPVFKVVVNEEQIKSSDNPTLSFSGTVSYTNQEKVGEFIIPTSNIMLLVPECILEVFEGIEILGRDSAPDIYMID